MPAIHSTSTEAAGLRGLHLYHFAMSNCSQRVRLALAEKELAWTSHHVDLPAGEHLTPGYLAINPNGVVPTLVHDGQVWTESNDIIAYLDELGSGPSLIPAGARDREAVEAMLRSASATQDAIKTLSHELLFRPFRQVTPDDVEAMKAAGANADLVAFMRDYAANDDAWRDRVAAARSLINAALSQLEARLGRHAWLSGASLGLADISWIVNLHRLRMCAFPLDTFPRTAAWADRMAGRDTFRAAISEYTP